jgi:hypothetical protein
MNFGSIQTRLTLWYSVVTAIGLFVFAGVMWFALEHRLVADVDERLRDQIHGFQTVIDAESAVNSDSVLGEEIAEFVRQLPEHTSIQLRDGVGNVIVSGGDDAGIPAGGRQDIAPSVSDESHSAFSISRSARVTES